MKWSNVVLFVLSLALPIATMSHPASGIAVNSEGTVFFLDTGAGVWQLARNGSVSKVPGRAFHWLTLDRAGLLAKMELPSIPEGGASIERTDHNLLLSSDFPLTVDAKGALYFPRKQDGRLRIFRLDPNGSITMFATVAGRTPSDTPGWINGSAIGPDGSFYYTEDQGVWKIAPKKEPVVVPVEIPESQCYAIPGLGAPAGTRMYRGIDIDAKGNVYVAASGCRALIKIAPDNSVTTVVRTTDTWSPTGVAISGAEVFVLEYLHTEGEKRREWIPRVRKLAADGTDAVLVTIKRP